MQQKAIEPGQSARIKVFWQPGCSSCLRTKEFLAKQGIEFESIDVHNDPAGMEELLALGARSVPIVALGGRFTYCQSFNDVVKFLDLKTKLMDPLSPEGLVARIDVVTQAAESAIREVVGKNKMDFVLYEGRSLVASAIAWNSPGRGSSLIDNPTPMALR